MKETLKNIGILLGSFILNPLALFLIVFCCPPGFVWLVWVSFQQKKRNARDIIKGLATFLIAVASSLDKFGNCAFGGLFTWALLKKDPQHPFGDNTETVSEVIGWGYQYGELTQGGLLLRSFLNFVDFTSTDHCEDARMTALSRAWNKVHENDYLLMYKPL